MILQPLHYITLYYVTLYYIVLYYIILYCIPPNSKVWGSLLEKKERAGLDGWHADRSWGPGARMGAGGSRCRAASAGAGHRERGGPTQKTDTAPGPDTGSGGRAPGPTQIETEGS